MYKPPAIVSTKAIKSNSHLLKGKLYLYKYVFLYPKAILPEYDEEQ